MKIKSEWKQLWTGLIPDFSIRETTSFSAIVFQQTIQHLICVAIHPGICCQKTIVKTLLHLAEYGGDIELNLYFHNYTKNRELQTKQVSVCFKSRL